MRALTMDEVGFVSGGTLSPMVLSHKGTTMAECAAFGKSIDDGGDIYSYSSTETTNADGSVTITITCSVSKSSSGSGSYCPDGKDGPACVRPGEGIFTYSGRVGQNYIEASGAIVQGYIDGLVEAWRSVDWAQEVKDAFADHIRGGMVGPRGSR
jgi:hypothetical protein